MNYPSGMTVADLEHVGEIGESGESFEKLIRCDGCDSEIAPNDIIVFEDYNYCEECFKNQTYDEADFNTVIEYHEINNDLFNFFRSLVGEDKLIEIAKQYAADNYLWNKKEREHFVKCEGFEFMEFLNNKNKREENG